MKYRPFVETFRLFFSCTYEPWHWDMLWHSIVMCTNSGLFNWILVQLISDELCKKKTLVFVKRPSPKSPHKCKFRSEAMIIGVSIQILLICSIQKKKYSGNVKDDVILKWRWLPFNHVRKVLKHKMFIPNWIHTFFWAGRFKCFMNSLKQIQKPLVIKNHGNKKTKDVGFTHFLEKTNSQISI